MKPIPADTRWILLACAAFLSTWAVADIPSAANGCVLDLVETTPSSDFTALEGGAVVRHEPTGLEWKRCAEGMSWTGTGCTGTAISLTWQGALQHADAVSGWRLPNINELRSIAERCRHSQAVNQQVFPDTPLSYFWSASPEESNPDFAWTLNAWNGFGTWDYTSNGYVVRLVREGQ